MPKQEDARRAKAVKLANAINRIEGVPITSFAEELSTRWANGEISGAEMKSQLLKRHHRTP